MGALIQIDQTHQRLWQVASVNMESLTTITITITKTITNKKQIDQTHQRLWQVASVNVSVDQLFISYTGCHRQCGILINNRPECGRHALYYATPPKTKPNHRLKAVINSSSALPMKDNQ